MYVCMYANRATYDRVTRITEQIRSVVDFDSIMVTRLNDFRSVAEYYHHLTATDPQILASPCNCNATHITIIRNKYTLKFSAYYIHTYTYTYIQTII